MIIEDQTVEVKVWDTNDAVIYVYERDYGKTDETCMRGKPKIVTAIPVNFADGDLSREAQLDRVIKVADALSSLYAYDDLQEISVSYYINHNECVSW